MKRVMCIAVLCALAATASANDETGIRRVQADQEAAWNHHDAAAYANLFTKDGDCVNVLGWWWKGRAQIQDRLTAAFAFVFRDSTLHVTDVQTKFLSPRIAVAHVRWSMEGSHIPPGMPEPREGIEIQILRKVGGRWMIESFQNTNAILERPFPAGPPAAAPAQ
ncbi:MAG: SgcJ/EcaC family oxidoreductase [Gammaproteobacteria bacterium]